MSTTGARTAAALAVLLLTTTTGCAGSDVLRTSILTSTVTQVLTTTEAATPPSPAVTPTLQASAASGASESIQVDTAQSAVDPLVDVTTGVISVFDGDTIRVIYRGESTPVRVLGLQAPEVAHGDLPDECYGIESRDHLRTLVLGKEVQLVIDPTQGDGPDYTDQYQRLLRYVEVVTPDGTTDVGESQIRGGFGTVYDEYPVNRTPFYQLAEDAAQSDRAGLWAACPS